MRETLTVDICLCHTFKRCKVLSFKKVNLVKVVTNKMIIVIM